MTYLPKYNPLTHLTPIKWFRTSFVGKMEMGPNEEKIKRMVTADYPEGCILVDISDVYALKINFMSQIAKYANGMPRRDVLIFHRWGFYDKTGTYQRSDVFDFLTTSLFSCSYLEIEERLIYAEYIVGKVNSAVL